MRLLLRVAACAVIGLLALSLHGCGGAQARQRHYVEFAMGAGADAAALASGGEVVLQGSKTANGVTIESTSMNYDPVEHWLMGFVTIYNNTGGPMDETLAEMVTISDPTVVSSDPYEYGDIAHGDSSGQWWFFFVPSGANFSFRVRISWTA